jgi:KUP system potassium uptake protein
MTQDAEGTPMALLHQLKHNQVLHEQVVLLTIMTLNDRRADEHRVKVTQLHAGFWRVIARYGFMETPNVPSHEAAARPGPRDLRGRTSYFLGRETFIATGPLEAAALAARALLVPRPQRPLADRVLRHPANEVVELGAQIEV